jgi:hypothetical protein
VRHEKLKHVLYVTRRGAFFEWSNAQWDDGYADKITRLLVGGWRKGPETIIPLTVEQASNWVNDGATLTGNYQRYFGELPPEAGSEETAMTVRLTAALKTKLEQQCC